MLVLIVAGRSIRRGGLIPNPEVPAGMQVDLELKSNMFGICLPYCLFVLFTF